MKPVIQKIASGGQNPPRRVEHAGFGKIQGRFAQILPPKVATPEHRMVAQAMLKVYGVNFAKPGTAIRLTPRR